MKKLLDTLIDNFSVTGLIALAAFGCLSYGWIEQYKISTDAYLGICLAAIGWHFARKKGA